MSKATKCISVFVSLAIVFLLLAAIIPSAGAASGEVPVWNKGDKWGYKIGEYGYFYGVGFEVVGEETINDNECYKVKIWWDGEYGEGSGYNFEYDEPWLSTTYKYVGYAYFTKTKLAIAKFTNEFVMRVKYDGSKFPTVTRAQDGFDYSDYTDLLENMKDWKYDIDTEFKITYEYNPPFVVYDYPLEVGKKWDSTSQVTVSWEYLMNYDMNAAMKSDWEEFGDYGLSGIEQTHDEGSDSTQFKLTGSFEVLREDSITTDVDTDSHNVFVIEYDVSADYITRATYSEIPTEYEGMAAPGGDATLMIVGGKEGSGTTYLDMEEGYPQKVDTGGYFSGEYTTVDPSSVENTYNDLAKSSSYSEDEGGDNTLLIIAAVIAVVMVVIIVVLFFLIKRMSRSQEPPQQPPQQPPYGQHPPPPQQPTYGQYPPHQPPNYPPERQ
ncbi:hypothetical protein [[Eubacterium] cellulosolvens]